MERKELLETITELKIVTSELRNLVWSIKERMRVEHSSYKTWRKTREVRNKIITVEYKLSESERELEEAEELLMELK